ncbi:MAG: class I SAM-dependent methyltransferase [Planctomycetota bacterium]
MKHPVAQPTHSGFEEPKSLDEGGSIDESIRQSWMNYLTVTLGRDAEFAQQRAQLDVTRQMARSAVITLQQGGWVFPGLRLLDVGSGHCSLGIEMALAGAQVTAVEPSDSWREVAERRSQAAGVTIMHVGATGENLPFPDQSFDAVVSKQVLEHVQSPSKCIAEMSRVLADNGRFHITCENYLSFREQHYGVPWLPLLPKSIGALYLRLLGRDPTFLKRHVTYTIWPKLFFDFARQGLIDDDWRPWLTTDPASWSRKRRWLYQLMKPFIGHQRAQLTLAALGQQRRWFRVGFRASGRKCQIFGP